MKLRFTLKDFILILGIVVAIFITVAALFYRDGLLSIKPQITKKIQAYNRPAVLVDKAYQILTDININ